MQALIWDIQSMPRPIEDPILAYQATAEVHFHLQGFGLLSKFLECLDSFAFFAVFRLAVEKRNLQNRE